MIIDLPATTTSELNRKLIDMRERGGTVSLSRVLTLIIVTDESRAESAIEAANAASFEHPCRVIVIAQGDKRGNSQLDGQIRVGGDAGASEVLVLNLFGELTEHGASAATPLLLPDAPVVAWWPGSCPKVPADDPVGRMATRRILDAGSAPRPHAELLTREQSYRPGDTDLSWTRLTLWRGLLASMLDQPPFEPITSVMVEGAADSPSTDLMAAWLALRLKCPVTRRKVKDVDGMQSVSFERKSGTYSLYRDEESTATLAVPGQPDRQVALARRNLSDCLAEELRRLDADEVYYEVLRKGLPMVHAADRRRTAEGRQPKRKTAATGPAGPAGSAADGVSAGKAKSGKAGKTGRAAVTAG